VVLEVGTKVIALGSGGPPKVGFTVRHGSDLRAVDNSLKATFSNYCPAETI